MVLVFDIRNRTSFNNIRKWHEEIQQNASAGVLCYLVGNFSDLEAEREVTQSEAQALVQELGFHHYIETSAYSGHNVASLFERLTKHMWVLGGQSSL